MRKVLDPDQLRLLLIIDPERMIGLVGLSRPNCNWIIIGY